MNNDNEILFTTHDGVGMKWGDEYYIVWTSKDALFFMEEPTSPFDVTDETVEELKQDVCETFSSKQKAIEFIKWNEPRFSLEDMRKCYDQSCEDHTGNYSTGSWEGYMNKLNIK